MEKIVLDHKCLARLPEGQEAFYLFEAINTIVISPRGREKIEKAGIDTLGWEELSVV